MKTVGRGSLQLLRGTLKWCATSSSDQIDVHQRSLVKIHTHAFPVRPQGDGCYWCSFKDDHGVLKIWSQTH